MSRRRFLGGVAAGVGALAVAPARVLASTSSRNVIRSGYLRTYGSQILDAGGSAVRIAGVNWYGMDCSSMVPGGLDHQTIDFICSQIASLGFNAVRLPFSLQAILENPVVTNYLGRNPGLKGRRVLNVLDTTIAECGRYGLKVILDNHRSEAGWSLESNGLWYTQSYSEADWLQAWEIVVRRYTGNSTVIGCDLRNEPGGPPSNASAWPGNGGATWGHQAGASAQPTDWAAAAERAGNAILSLNPNLLILIEGVRSDPAGPIINGKRELYWPGGNLMGVGSAGAPRGYPRAIKLNVPNRLIYSSHDYGPNMYSGLAWCQLGTTASTPDACYGVWDQTWGYIAKQNIAPVLLGEFGTVNGYKPGDTTPQQYYTDPNPVNAQGAWFTYLLDYVKANGIHWTYWALNGTQSAAPGRNPSQPDWYGILRPDWSTYASAPMMRRLTASF